MPNITLTTMVMVENPATGEVLVQDRLLSFKGLAFPGGHVDGGESLYACAVREVKEETGLDVRDLQPCGVLHYCGSDTQDRYFVFLYSTSTSSGTLTPEMAEGRHFWMAPDELRRQKFSNRFGDYLPMFFGPGHSEAFCLYPGGTSAGHEFKYF